MRYKELSEVPCSISRPLVILGDRWTLVILKWAFAGVRRFNHFQSAMEISRSRLQDRLDRLVEHEILAKVQTDSAHAEYRLTRKGHDIYPILMAIKDWGDTYMAPEGPPVRYQHRDCDGEAHVRLECDSCAQELTAHDVLPTSAHDPITSSTPGNGPQGADASSTN
ncbi:helix-turn-helix transcriptional regulator [Rhodococcus sp. D-46]|uniref:winged helix-turn-helix transcriptional regulator n=1 Tax=unclassified Rhodococcus (in: high G+C Gram-positive bacteria) TaxID=192944 RepID=UPI0009EB693E|nr:MULTISPECIES: helix-turn-helix domain-containing protein [unclassified Rhodococcus (in: high G+C Gram-positive bacteria)]NHE64826.1 helix-turn-helix transcriptional regulator [Rhodococcus sp. D-46]